jgi:hypothetical protein
MSGHITVYVIAQYIFRGSVTKRLDGSTVYWQHREIERKKGEKEIKRRSRKEKKEKKNEM